MGNQAIFPLAAAALVLAAVTAFPETAAAQGTPCGSPAGRMPMDHSGETPVFTGIDHDDRAFTLTQNLETGAWSLWVIAEFTEQSGGLEVGKPCIVVAGAESKLLSATVATEPAAEEQAAAAVAAAPVAADAEMFRVTGIDDGEVLDIRTGAGTDYESIAAMPPDATGISVGTCKTVDGYRYPWCEATWQGTAGWASACCLEGERSARRPD